jgi:hypothetical protein
MLFACRDQARGCPATKLRAIKQPRNPVSSHLTLGAPFKYHRSNTLITYTYYSIPQSTNNHPTWHPRTLKLLSLSTRHPSLPSAPQTDETPSRSTYSTAQNLKTSRTGTSCWTQLQLRMFLRCPQSSIRFPQSSIRFPHSLPCSRPRWKL